MTRPSARSAVSALTQPAGPVVRPLPGCPLVAPLAGLGLAGLEPGTLDGAVSVPASPTREVPALCALLQQTAVGLEQRIQSAGSTGSRRSSRRASFFSCKGDLSEAGRQPPGCPLGSTVCSIHASCKPVSATLIHFALEARDCYPESIYTHTRSR